MHNEIVPKNKDVRWLGYRRKPVYLLALAGLLSCSNGATDTPSSDAVSTFSIDSATDRLSSDAVSTSSSNSATDTPSSDAVSTLKRSPSLSWETPFGPGDAQVPELLELAPDEGPGGLSRVRGAVFLDEGREILFVGTYHEGEPTLTPSQLLDSFVTSLRALEAGSAPAVSIDPTSEQVSRGLNEGDHMPVRYVANKRTRLGAASFEADRVMKTLGAGRDNVTREPVTSNVPGYRNQLDMYELDRGGTYTPWTRFWIEQEMDEVQVSNDSSTVLVKAKLIVRARSQVRKQVVDGVGNMVRMELVDGDTSDAAPSALWFAQHMTDHLDDASLSLDFAGEFPVYRELVSHATLVSLAEAVRPGSPAPRRPTLDLQWLLEEHLVSPVDTHETTPATIAVRQFTSGRTRMTLQLRGGVDLAPVNRYRNTDSLGKELERRIKQAVAREPDRRYWQVDIDGNSYHVYSRSFTVSMLRVRQVDLQVGNLSIERVLRRDGGGPSVGVNWSLNLPSAKVATEVAEFERLGKLPRYVRVRGVDGKMRTLGRVGQMTLPGNPPTLSYSGAAQVGRERSFLQYENLWVYIDGHVDFVSTRGGPIEWRLSPGTSILHFSTDPPHRLLRVRTQNRDEEYSYDGARLTKITDSDQRAIELVYDAKGGLSGLRGNGGSVVEYRTAPDGFLNVVVDGPGNHIAYARKPGTTSVAGMSARLTGERQPSRGAFELRDAAGWAKLVEVAGENSNDSQVFIGVEPSSAGKSASYRIVIGREQSDLSEVIARYVESFGVRGFEGNDVTPVRAFFQEHPGVRGRDRMVLVGPVHVLRAVSVALRGLAHRPTVVTASDPRRALAKD